MLYIKQILSQRENFGPNDLIKDEILDKYEIKCNNDCNNNGKCIKSNISNVFNYLSLQLKKINIKTSNASI